MLVSTGGSHATWIDLHVVAVMPRLVGAAGGRAVLTVNCSDFPVRMNMLPYPSSAGCSPSGNYT